MNLTASKSFSAQLNSKTRSSTSARVRAHQSQLVSKKTHHFSTSIFFFTPPLHLYVFLGLRNLSVPPISPRLGLLTDLKNCPDSHLEVESQQRGGGGGAGGPLKSSEAPSCPSSSCRDDVVTQAICSGTWEERGKGRLTSIC